MIYWKYWHRQRLFPVFHPVEIVHGVKYMQNDSDTRTLEFFLGFVALARGIWNIFAEYDPSGVVDLAMGDMPNWFWSLVMISLGIFRMYAVLVEYKLGRIFAACGLLTFWLMLAGRFWHVNPQAQNISINIALAMGSAWVLWRLVDFRSWVGQAPRDA